MTQNLIDRIENMANTIGLTSDQVVMAKWICSTEGYTNACHYLLKAI